MEHQVEIKDVYEAKDITTRNEAYNAYVKSVTPKHNGWINALNAFWSGGSICLLGQILNTFYMYLGRNEKDAGLCVTITLVALSVIFTGLNWYPKIAKTAGAGTVVPITGFANSIASAAIDYKVQGQVFGIGCFIFSIAGPVILYGICSSWILGFVFWLFTL